MRPIHQDIYFIDSEEESEDFGTVGSEDEYADDEAEDDD